MLSSYNAYSGVANASVVHDQIAGRQQSADGDAPEECVAPERDEALRCDDLQPRQPNNHDRQLKAQPKRERHINRKREILTRGNDGRQRPSEVP